MVRDLLATLLNLHDEGQSCVVITVVERKGSVPQDVGAKAIVTAAGLHGGTVGGGKVEAAAITKAQEMLAAPGPHTEMLTLHLKQDLGMSCGGRIQMLFEKHEAQPLWQVAVFGAGHVAQALIPTLVKLPLQITCWDDRREWLEKLPEATNLRREGCVDSVAHLMQLPRATQVVIMTQGHRTDLPIATAALQANFAYVGVIGSQSKGARLRQGLTEAGLDDNQVAQLYCPIGLPLGQNHPQEIAISIAAQLLWHRDREHGQAAQKWRAQVQKGENWAH